MPSDFRSVESFHYGHDQLVDQIFTCIFSILVTLKCLLKGLGSLSYGIHNLLDRIS